MRDCEYWIWLQNAYGTGAKIKPIIEYFGSARELYEAGSYEWRISGIIDQKHVDKLLLHSPSESGSIMRVCEENGWEIITPQDEQYPFLLTQISDLPAVLYADGDIETLMTESNIAMVGTRNASVQGIKVAGAIAQRLSLAGMTIVSGGALGIDAASHEGALSVDKKTVAVLGCGLGTNYLKTNEDLRNRIKKNGVLITEFPPFSQASRISFPKRNRIISGMSLATVVVEAGERSGSLITAKNALSQGRRLYAVPGDLFSSAYSGTSEIINNGAKPLFNAREIVEDFMDEFPERFDLSLADEPFALMLSRNAEDFSGNVNHTYNKRAEKTQSRVSKADTEPVKSEPKPLPDTASETAKKIYAALDGDTEFDTIVEKSGLNVVKVLSGITELEMQGVIEVLPGRKYKKIQ